MPHSEPGSVEVSDVRGRRSEDVVAEVSVQQEAEPVAGSESIAHHSKRLGPEVGADVHVVVRLHVDVRLGAVSDRREVHADRGLASITDDSSQINSLGNGDGAKATCGSHQSSRGLVTELGLGWVRVSD